MVNTPNNSTSHSIWDQAPVEDYADWPPQDELRGFKRALLGAVLAVALGVGGWWAWDTLVPEDYREQALEYMEEGDYPAAVVELKRVIQEHPDDGELRWLLAGSYLQMDQPGLALEHLEAAFERGYFEQPLLLALARAYLRDGRYDEALQLAREWHDEAAPERAAEWMVLRGRALLRLNRREAALDALVEALKLDAGNIEAKRELAYLGIGEELSAWVGRDIDAALSTNLGQPETWLLKAEQELALGEYDEALASFDVARELAPDNPYPLSGAVRVLLKTDRLGAAGERIALLAQRFSENPAGAFVRARYAWRQGENEEALTALKIVLKHDPYHAQSLYLLGTVQLAVGESEQAVLNLSRYRRLEPDDAEGRKQLARALLASGQQQRAVELLQPLVASGEHDIEIATILQSALQLQAKPEPAGGGPSPSGDADFE